jgi:type VI secretion system VasD/TssJ family lipoprotein
LASHRFIKEVDLRNYGLLPIVGCLLILAACSATQLPPPQWTYQKDAIRLHIKADGNLNLADNEAHTLSLCIYQLSDPNVFNQLANDQDGLYKLLNCGLFGAGAAAARRVIVQPGQVLEMTLDRAEGARYVAFVAGYNILQRARIVKMVQIPEYVEKKGFFRTTKIRMPAPLTIDLILGPLQITTISTSTFKGT